MRPAPPDRSTSLLNVLGTEPFVLLDDRAPGGRGVRLFRRPATLIQCHQLGGVAGCIMEMEAHLARGRHVVGFLSYEMNGAFEFRAQRPEEQHQTPLLQLGVFDAPEHLTADEADAFFATVAPAQPLKDLQPHLEPAEYQQKFEHLLNYIRSGDVYQVNLAFPIRFDYGGDPVALYAAMRSRQPVAHGALIRLDDTAILSVSPELHLDIRHGLATTRPMKGTIGRGPDANADQINRSLLESDAKQRAENLMIVDLMRNDLARISVAGTVRVTAPFEVETYPTFHALTSTVSARLQAGMGVSDVLAALFPCGSITGAPKVRAMEIIRELEDQPRGVYTGSIGAFSPDGGLNLNVAIRTAILTRDGKGRYSVGSGVVADSVAEAEYRECLLKAQILSELGHEFGLIETLRLSASGDYSRLEGHLERLATSAKQLEFRLDLQDVRDQLERLRSSCADYTRDRRVRLELHRDGRLDLTHATLAPLSPGPLRVRIYDPPVDRANPFLRHKTTQRGFWDKALIWAQAHGANDALCMNRQGRLTEATRFNLFLQRDGMLLTPPLTAGLLPGVLRAELLQTGRACERDLSPDDLENAEAIYLGNSLRGLMPCVVDPV